MLKQKRENSMLNELITSRTVTSAPLHGKLFFTVLITLLLSACAGMQEGSALGKKASSLNPASNETYVEAISAMKSGDTEKAQALLIKLINQNPNISNAHVNLGIIFVKNKSYNEAENSFNRALIINPNNIYALNQLGFLYRRQGDFTKAKESYEKAININSDYAYAHLNLGILYDLYMYDLVNAIEQYKIYLGLTKNEDKQVSKWIVDLERRYKKSLALK